MPDYMDHSQEMVLREIEHAHVRARRPDVKPPKKVQCKDCPDLIPSARLLRVPDAERCVVCQRIVDNRRRLTRRDW